ncbi:MAG: HPr family phosphocarrier protein [Firmicutes bacterium]|nr:HPr family phosphocarrier protein [Bacillota bacterium]
MAEALLEIKNKSGLHLRPAAEFVKKANEFEANITLEREGKVVNGKSIIHVQALGVRQGMTIKLRAEGKDAQEAIAALSGLVNSGFGEG